MWTDAPASLPPDLPPLAVVDDPDQAAALLQPERQRLIEALHEPDSASGLARRFALPRQRLNYHLRELERAGLVELVDQRRKGNCIERVVRASARSYVISPAALGDIGRSPEAIAPDRLSASHLVALAARLIREVGSLLARAGAARRRVATLAIDTEIRFRSAEDRAACAEALSAAIRDLAARYHDPDASGGRTFRLVASVYPKPSADAAGPSLQETAS
jgi:DNA-binding transcriptional ArsR family regulator